MMEEYVRAIIIIIASAILAKSLKFLIARYAKKVTQKTKTDLDDYFLAIVSKPLYVLIILGGLYVGMNTLQDLSPYRSLSDGAFFVVVVVTVAGLLTRLTSGLVTRWLKVNKRFEKTPKLINKIIAVTIYALASLMILSYFNVEISPLIATLGVGGLAVGLALQPTLSNLFSGVYLLSDRPVEVGDFIEIDDKTAGYVEDIGWRSTRIRTLPNHLIIIPNSKLADSTIRNLSKPILETSVSVACGVSYDADLERVEKVAGQEAAKIQKKHAPSVAYTPLVRFKAFGDSNIDFIVIMRAPDPLKRFIMSHDLIKGLKKRFDKEKIEIAWPQRVVHMKK